MKSFFWKSFWSFFCLLLNECSTNFYLQKKNSSTTSSNLAKFKALPIQMPLQSDFHSTSEEKAQVQSFHLHWSQKLLSSNVLVASNWYCFNSKCTSLWRLFVNCLIRERMEGKEASRTNRAQTGSRSAGKLSETNALQTFMLKSLNADDSFIQFATIFPLVIGSQENSAVDFNLCVMMMRKVDSLNILFSRFFNPA